MLTVMLALVPATLADGVKVAVYTLLLLLLTTGSLKVPLVATTSLATMPTGVSLKV